MLRSRSCQSVGEKFTKYIDFEAYLAKFEVSTYTKFTKDDCRTIAVTNKRLGTGKINVPSFCDNPTGRACRPPSEEDICRCAPGNSG